MLKRCLLRGAFGENDHSCHDEVGLCEALYETWPPRRRSPCRVTLEDAGRTARRVLGGSQPTKNRGDPAKCADALRGPRLSGGPRFEGGPRARRPHVGAGRELHREGVYGGTSAPQKRAAAAEVPRRGGRACPVLNQPRPGVGWKRAMFTSSPTSSLTSTRHVSHSRR